MRITFLLITLAMAASAGPCMVGSLADYISLGAGGCSLGATPDAPVVKGFTITPGLFGATPLDSGFVTITPIDLPSQKGINVAYSTTAVLAALETFFQFQITGPNLVGVASSSSGSTRNSVCPACLRQWSGLAPVRPSWLPPTRPRPCPRAPRSSRRRSCRLAMLAWANARTIR